MNPKDLEYLEKVQGTFIDTAILRLRHSGVMEHNFRIPMAEFMAQTTRKRLHDSVAENAVEFFEHHRIKAKYDKKFSGVDIQIDLSTCTLNFRQSQDLTEAMSYRENTV